jgi:hypothetical protein
MRLNPKPRLNKARHRKRGLGEPFRRNPHRLRLTQSLDPDGNNQSLLWNAWFEDTFK